MSPSRYFRSTLFAALAFVVVLCAAAGLVGCNAEPEVPSAYSRTTCARACTNARRLCGPEALKPSTGTCEDVCRVSEQGGGDYRTGCLSAAKTCERIGVCSK